MASLSKQEREKIRIQVKHQYEDQINDLRKRCKEYDALQRENEKLKQENEEIKNKIAQYEEWLERMQDYCNFSDEELKALKDKAKVSAMVNEMINGLFSLNSRVTFSQFLKP